MMKTLAIVELFDAKFPGNGGKVVGKCKSVEDYLSLATDRDGARKANWRLWEVDSHVTLGTKVYL